MRALAISLLLLLGAATGAAAQDGEASCGVRYLSADHVYLDAGRLAGLEVGMTVRIVRDGTEVAELQVEYASDHSASCRIVQSVSDVQVNDRAFFSPEGGSATAAPAEPDTVRVRRRELRPAAATTARAAAPGPRVTGGASVRWEHSSEAGGTDVTDDVLTVPFRLRVRELGRGWEFRSRGSLRHLTRGGGNDVRARDEWRNRIYEVAFVRDGRRDPWHLAVGRIGVRAAAAAGPFDGLAVDRRVADGLRVGAFGGWAPRWQDLGFGTEDQLAGVSLQLDPVNPGAGGLGLVLAGVGRYHKGEVSREYLALTTTWRGGPGLSLLQAAEVDVNRGWKRDAGAAALSLTSFALVARWRADRRLSFTAGFDDRELVRTWETRDRPDSLFQDAGRRGLRGGIEVRGGRGGACTWTGACARPRTAAWIRSRGAPASGCRACRRRAWTWTCRSAGSRAPTWAAWRPTVALARRSRGGWTLRGAAGLYKYTSEVNVDDRISTWISAAVERELGRTWSVLGEARSDWGDSGDVRSLAGEIHCRF